MITALGVALIIILVGVEVCCFTLLKRTLKQLSDARTDARRAFYRARVYKHLNEQRALKKSREGLWRYLQEGCEIDADEQR